MPTRIDDERQDEFIALAKTAPPAARASPPGTQRAPTLPIVLAVVGVVIVLVLVWARDSSTEAAATTTAVPTVVAPTTTAIQTTPTPSYPDITPHVDAILAAMKTSRWQEAATIAEGALTKEGLRDEDHKLLVQYAVTCGLKVLYLQHFEPLNQTQHQRMVDTYLALKARTQGANVEIDPPLVVASEAFSHSQFLLARIAFEEALKDKSFNPEVDRDITHTYVSTLYGLGEWYTTAEPNSPLYQQGLRYLSASHLVAVKYQTGQGQAAMRLQQLVSDNEEQWPAPVAVPLLP